MDERQYERIAAWTGIAFVVFIAAAAFIAGRPLPGGATTEIVRRYLTHHRNQVLSQGFLLGCSGVFLLWWLGYLRSFLQRAEGGNARLAATAFGAGVALVACAFTAGIFLPSLALHYLYLTVEPGILRWAAELTSMSYAALGFFSGVLALAATLVIWRTRVLSRTVAWLGLFTAAVAFLGTPQILFSAGFYQPGGSSTLAPFLVFDLWVLIMSVELIQKTRERA